MSSSARKKKNAAAKALATEESESTKEAKETSLGDDDDDLQLEIVEFHRRNLEIFEAITSIFIDQASIMEMISAYESYGNPDEFNELPSVNVDILKEMIANGRFTEEAFQKVYRALPLTESTGSSKDASPNSKGIALVDDNTTPPTIDEVRKKFEGPKCVKT